VNPYDQPESEQGQGMEKYTTPPLPLGGFVMTFVIMDLVFCCLRLLLAAVGASAIGSPELEQTGLADTAGWEVGTAFAMAGLGIPANILILCRKPLGVTLGWATLAATAINVGVGTWQGATSLRQFEEGSPEYLGGMIGIGLVIVVRIGLNVAYLFALVIARRRIPPPEPDLRDE